MSILIVVILFVLILINAFQYFFSINVIAYVKGLFSPKTNVDIVVDQSTYRPVSVPEINIRNKYLIFLGIITHMVMQRHYVNLMVRI
jgi:hypothetical protein